MRPTIYPHGVTTGLLLQSFPKYLPTAYDESMTVIQKINKVIRHLEEIGTLSNHLVDQWNQVMEWILNDGVSESVIYQLDVWLKDGTLEEIIKDAIFKIDEKLEAIEGMVTENGIKVDEQMAGLVKQLNDSLIEMNNELDKKTQGLKFKDLPRPIYIAHRGGSSIYPENTMEAFRASYATGMTVLEQDVQTLADGALAVMHDTTMNRTTNKVGGVDSESTISFTTATINPFNGFEGLHPPLLADVFSEFGNRANYVVETKDRNTSQKMVKLIQDNRLEDYVLVQSFNLGDLAPAVSAGLPTMFLTTSVSPATIKEAGVQFVGVSRGSSTDYVRSCVELGLEVFVYTVNRRYDRDRYLKAGATGFFSDEPLYLSGKLPTRKTDTFRQQRYYHGMLAPSANSHVSGLRGSFKSPKSFGWETANTEAKRDFSMQGYLGKLPNSFRLDFTGYFMTDSSTKTYWLSVAFCTPNDFYDDISNTSSGYHALLALDGNLSLYRTIEGQSTQMAVIQTPAVTVGQAVPFNILVTENTITITREDTGDVLNVTDNKYRNGYLHFGRRIIGAMFADVVLT